MDALLSTVQMPGGIPVATVAVNGAKNAALLACEIISVTDNDMAAKLDEMRKSGAQAVLEKNRDIENQYNK